MPGEVDGFNAHSSTLFAAPTCQNVAEVCEHFLNLQQKKHSASFFYGLSAAGFKAPPGQGTASRSQWCHEQHV